PSDQPQATRIPGRAALAVIRPIPPWPGAAAQPRAAPGDPGRAARTRRACALACGMSLSGQRVACGCTEQANRDADPPAAAGQEVARADHSGEVEVSLKNDARRRVATGANHPASHSSALRRGPGTPALVLRRGTRAPVRCYTNDPPSTSSTHYEAFSSSTPAHLRRSAVSRR